MFWLLTTVYINREDAYNIITDIYIYVLYVHMSITVCVQIFTGRKFRDFHESAQVRENKMQKFPYLLSHVM